MPKLGDSRRTASMMPACSSCTTWRLGWSEMSMGRGAQTSPDLIVPSAGGAPSLDSRRWPFRDSPLVLNCLRNAPGPQSEPARPMSGCIMVPSDGIERGWRGMLSSAIASADCRKRSPAPVAMARTQASAQ